jgi:hypothetical protein
VFRRRRRRRRKGFRPSRGAIDVQAGGLGRKVGVAIRVGTNMREGGVDALSI